MNSIKAIAMLLLVCACSIEGYAQPDWKTDYEDIKREILNVEEFYTPVSIFMKLVHLRAIIKAHPNEVDMKHRLDKDIDRLVDIAEIHIKNCNEKRFRDIHEAAEMHVMWRFKSNMQVYLSDIKQRMIRLCETAYHEGKLPLNE